MIQGSNKTMDQFLEYVNMSKRRKMQAFEMYHSGLKIVREVRQLSNARSALMRLGFQDSQDHWINKIIHIIFSFMCTQILSYYIYLCTYICIQ